MGPGFLEPWCRAIPDEVLAGWANTPRQMNSYRLLHVEDSTDDADLVRHALKDAPFSFTLTRVETEEDYVAQLDAAPPDAILCDYDMPAFSAELALEILVERAIDLPFIIVSNHVGENAAVVAMQNGASDYLPKRSLHRLAKSIETGVDRCHARREMVRAQDALRESEAIRRGILNSLRERIAVVDGLGTIVTVNKAWESFESGLHSVGLPALRVGASYLHALKASLAAGDHFAGPLSEALRAVIRREQRNFAMGTRIGSGPDARWFETRVIALEGSEQAAVVSHRDVTHQMLGHAALEEANERLKTLSKRLLGIQEEERLAISRELHDDIGQTLGALKIGLHRLEGASAKARPGLADECMAAVHAALEKLRTLAMELRPPQLDQLGLKEALEWLAARQSAVSGLAVVCRFEGLDARPPPALESACYRIVQEALNNATRHARAKNVVISVEWDCCSLRCDVRDDGFGFDADAARVRGIRSGSMGLIGMEERAHLAGGRLIVESIAGAGTLVSATFPVAAKARAA